MRRGRRLTEVGVPAVLVLSSRLLAGPAAAGGGPVVNSLGMRMVPVPAGSFVMGSTPATPLRQEEEIPHRVTLSRAFRISATEVTQRQWRALMPFNPSPQQGDALPVTAVSWAGAREFCVALSRKEGGSYRLPTEAEWEYACRAGGDDRESGGELDASAWYADNSDGAAHAVGSKKANAWGLHDMLGNVAEWTLDRYAPYPRVEEERDPAGPDTGFTRVVRGGAYRGLRHGLRCAARTGTPESYQLPHLGFRVVQDADR
jgi:formylglycine-generating enzyme required for sulfatase activity